MRDDGSGASKTLRCVAITRPSTDERVDIGSLPYWERVVSIEHLAGRHYCVWILGDTAYEPGGRDKF